jgi:hypothetical protein
MSGMAGGQRYGAQYVKAGNIKPVCKGIPKNLNIFSFKTCLTQKLVPKEKYCSVHNPFVYDPNKMTGMHATISQFYSFISLFLISSLGHYSILHIICER